MADCLAAVVHHAEEGWRKAMGAQGMFQIGLVEKPVEVLLNDSLWQEKLSAVVRGRPLTLAEEDKPEFRDRDEV